VYDVICTGSAVCLYVGTKTSRTSLRACHKSEKRVQPFFSIDSTVSTGFTLHATGLLYKSREMYLTSSEKSVYRSGRVLSKAVVPLNIPESVLYAAFVKRLKNDTCLQG